MTVAITACYFGYRVSVSHTRTALESAPVPSGAAVASR